MMNPEHLLTEYSIGKSCELITEGATRASPRPSVCCALFRPGTSGMDVLLHLRADNGLWGLPGGGIEYGESIEQAAIREMQEETGYTVKVVGLAHVHSDPATGAIFLYPDGERVHYICLTVVCVNPVGQLRASEESLALYWYSYEYNPLILPEPFSPIHRQRLAAAWEVLQRRWESFPLG